MAVAIRSGDGWGQECLRKSGGGKGVEGGLDKRRGASHGEVEKGEQYSADGGQEDKNCEKCRVEACAYSNLLSPKTPHHSSHPLSYTSLHSFLINHCL